LITAFVSYTEIGIHIDFNEVAIPTIGTDEEKVVEIVQRMADQFSVGISSHPQDWHMLQRIWIDGDFMERT
jgi:KDO2-lipid IV(A) lauroyltransferase